MANLATINTNILADSGIDDINVIVSTGSYANPAWITSLAWTKITGAPSGIVTGTGTTNYLPKFTGSTTIGNSALYDGGSFGGFNSTGLAARTFVINAASGRPLALELIENANVHAIYFRPNNSGYNLISSNYISGGVYLPLSLSARENNADLVLATSGNLLVGTTSDNGARLQVSGTGVAFNFTTSNGLIGNINSSAANGGYVTWQTSGTTIADLGTAQQVFGSGGNDTFGINARGARSLILGTNNTGRLTISSSGNLGLGVTPSAWNSAYKAMQFGTTGAIFGESGDAANYFTTNTFVDSVGFKYITSDWALGYFQENGVHSWRNAPSGTAGNAINFTQAMTLTSGGNLGLGVTPSAWFSTVKAIDISTATALWAGGNGQPALGYNVFVNTSGNLIYKTSEFASRYEQISGQHQWFTAPSGTAGNAISFTQAMTLDSSGRLGIGTPNPGKSLDIVTNVSQDGIRITGSSNPRLTIIDSTNNVQFDALTTDTEAVIRTDTNHPLHFTTNGALKMSITSGGNVLIGNPPAADNGARLQVSGTSTFSSFITAQSSGGSGLRIYGGSGTNQWDMYLNGANLRFSDNTGTGSFVVDRPATFSSNVTATNALFNSTSTQLILQNVDGGTNAERIGMFMTSGDIFKILSLNDNNTTRVDNIITANVLSGNVGIGTSSPNRKLEVITGSLTTNGIRLTYAGGVTSEGMDITYLNTGATTTSFDSIYNSDSAVMQFRMKTAGTPVTALSILGSGEAFFSKSVQAYSFVPVGTNPPSGGMYAIAPDAIAFSTNTTNRVTILGNGNVGIGTASPASLLSVHGQFRVNTTNGDGNENRLFFNPGGAADPAKLYLYNEAQSNTIYITANGASYFNSGNVLIGTTTSTGATLEVNGTIRTGTLDTGYVSGFWKLGRAVIGTQPTNTHQIIVEINGQLYVIPAASL